MSDPSSFLLITVLFGIEGICSQSCISRLVLSASGICGEMFAVQHSNFPNFQIGERISGGISKCRFLPRKLHMEMSSDCLETGGVNELFVVVTVDASFTTSRTTKQSNDHIFFPA